MTQVLPWQTVERDALWEVFKKNRLAHALLLIGESGIEENQFAYAFAEALLCETQTIQGRACEACAACHLMHAHSHPDFVIVAPEKNSVIKIDQIRELTHFFHETSMRGGYRIVVIEAAHRMNISAANALLKTLEEPTAQTLILLVTHPGLRLPLTIMSRCQKILFKKPDTSTALQWMENPDALLLNLASGSPVKANNFSEAFKTLRAEVCQSLAAVASNQANPLHLAQKWSTCELEDFFTILIDWLYDLIRFKLTKHQSGLLNTDCYDAIAKLSLQLSNDHLFAFRDIVLQRYQSQLGLQNLNKQLLLEELLIRWRHVSC